MEHLLVLAAVAGMHPGFSSDWDVGVYSGFSSAMAAGTNPVFPRGTGVEHLLVE